MSDFDVRWIDAAQTHDLRTRILRPGHPEDVDFPGDGDDATRHAGAFDAEGQLVAIASIYREGRPTDPDGTAWRVRGMAAELSVRRRGTGRAVLNACVEHARDHGGHIVWCNARTPAIPFYEAQGWVVLGTEFEIPTAGPHYVMEFELSSDRTIPAT